MTLIRSIATVGGYTVLSRVTGFARDMMVAQVLGAGGIADAFFVAFKLPNLFRRLFAEGAFNAAFVPLYAGTHETEGQAAAHAFAEQAMAVLAWGLAFFVAFMELIMPWAMWAFAPGFDAVPGKMELAGELTRITFPYLLFISLVSLQSGVLNSIGRFAAAAGTPVLLNVVMMAALVGLTPYTATPGHALAWGTTAAGVIQCAWLVGSLRAAGVHLRLVRPRLSEPVKLLLKRIVPGAMGAGVYQVNLMVDTIIASLVSDGAVSLLYYADRVNQLPLGVVGIAIGTALLPVLSRQLRAGNVEAASHSQNRAIEFGLLLTLPAMAALMSVGDPIVKVLFEHGVFGPDQTRGTAAALSAFAIGLPAYVLVKAVTPAFFARHDTTTPVKAATVAMICNVAINLALMKPLGHVGIALATGLSAWINLGQLAVILRKRGFLVLDDRLKARLPRIVAATIGMTLVLLVAQRLLAPAFAGPQLERWLALLALLAAGMGSFAVLAQLTGAARLGEMRRMVRRDAA